MTSNDILKAGIYKISRFNGWSLNLKERLVGGPTSGRTVVDFVAEVLRLQQQRISRFQTEILPFNAGNFEVVLNEAQNDSVLVSRNNHRISFSEAPLLMMNRFKSIVWIKEKNMLAKIARIIAGLLLLVCVPVTLVNAQPFEYYVSGNVGISFLRDAETINTEEPEFGLDIAYKNDAMLSGAFGLINDNYRSELEVSYQKHDFDDNEFAVTVSIPDFEATAEKAITGDLELITGLVNVFYDFDTRFPAFKPYITGGLGFTKVNWDINAFARYTENNVLLESIEIEGRDSDTAFSYQLGAGLGFVLTDNATLDLRYRYLSVPSMKFFELVETEANTHNITAGLRVSF